MNSAGMVQIERVPIQSDSDIVIARQKGRELAMRLGFQLTDAALMATAISELARNIVMYAREGEIILGIVEDGSRLGVSVAARDQGPGIEDVDLALQKGFSTSSSYGLGLSGVKRLMDEFQIISSAGNGTTVTVRKWK